MMRNKIILDYFEKLYPIVRPGLITTNNFEFLIAVVLSAQSTDISVNKVVKNLFSKYDIDSLAKAEIKEIEKVLNPLGLYKRKSVYIKEIAQTIIEKYNYNIPDSMDELMKLKGVGRKTANVIMAQVYNEPHMPVDTHINRVSKRLNLANEKDNVYIVEQKLLNAFPKEKIVKLHLQFIWFGRDICNARNPKCFKCELNDICKYYKEVKDSR